MFVVLEVSDKALSSIHQNVQFSRLLNSVLFCIRIRCKLAETSDQQKLQLFPAVLMGIQCILLLHCTLKHHL